MNSDILQAAASIAAALIQKDPSISSQPTPQLKQLLLDVYRVLEPIQQDLADPPKPGFFGSPPSR